METLFGKFEIEYKVQQLAQQIEKDHSELIIITVLNGAMFFSVDLMRALKIPFVMSTISLGSYDGSQSSGVVRLNNDITVDIQGKNVLIVEDIVDTGLTMHYLKTLLSLRKPNSIKICSFLSKPSRREIDVKIDYLGFEIEDFFVVGYGLDYNEQYRGLNRIAILEGV